MTTSTAFQSQLEAWKKEHDDAMEYWAVQGRVDKDLDLLSRVRSLDHVWTENVQAGREVFDQAVVRDLFDFYQSWYKCTADLTQKIDAVQRKGRAVLRAKEFQAA